MDNATAASGTGPGQPGPVIIPENGDWRTQLQPDSRQRIVNKIMETLKMHSPFSGQEGLLELKKIAVRFEEKIYTAATSQSDYVRMISLKMLTMTKSQPPMGNAPQPNPSNNNQNPADSGRPSHQEDVHILQQSRVTAPQPLPLQQSSVTSTRTRIGAVPIINPANHDWRTETDFFSRERIVSKIMETFKRHLPFSGQEELLDIEKTAVRFEEETYTAATSKEAYLKKISLRMLVMETKSQTPMGNAPQLNGGTSNQNSADSASLDSTAQTGNVHGGDWQEEAYQKIRSMKEMYFVELNELYQRIASKLELHDIPQQPKYEHLEKLKFFKAMLEKLVQFLRLNKNDIQINHRDKIGSWEKQIVNIVNSIRPRKNVSSLPQGQLPQPRMHAMQQNSS